MTMIQIAEPPSGAGAKASVDAFLAMAFRPLYVAGTAWAAISIGLWVFAPRWIAQPLMGVFWHAHEMLWGFIATIAVGFLLTASATWTGINPLRGKPLAWLCGLWLVARVGFLAGGGPMFAVAAVSEFAFFSFAAAALLRVVHASKNRRNYGVPWLVLALGIVDLAYLDAVLRGKSTQVMPRFDAGLVCMALVALLVARRVIPFFAMRAVPGLQIPMRLRSGHVQLALGVAGLAALLAPGLGAARRNLPAAFALALTGAISLAQVLSWKSWAVRRRPLLWILYTGYAMLGVGLLLKAAYEAGLSEQRALHVHVIAVGGFSLLIIGMVTRIALGHLGRPLALDRSMLASYCFMLAAAALRLLGLAPWPAGMGAIRWAGAAMIAAFGLYLWRFLPMLARPRQG
jgi:uncharacterized protein involved in response to NO